MNINQYLSLAFPADIGSNEYTPAWIGFAGDAYTPAYKMANGTTYHRIFTIQENSGIQWTTYLGNPREWLIFLGNP